MDDINIEDLLVCNPNCICLENVNINRPSHSTQHLASEPPSQIDRNLEVPQTEIEQQVDIGSDVSLKIVKILSQILAKENAIVELLVESKNLSKEMIQLLRKS